MLEAKVKFCTYAAGEFLDEDVWYWTSALAKAEGKTFEQVEAELKPLLEFRDSTNPKYPPPNGREVWGPQELADRLNALPEEMFR